MDGGAWWAAVYGVAQSWTRLKQLSSSSSVPSKIKVGDFPGGPVVKTLSSHHRGHGFDPLVGKLVSCMQPVIAS